MPIIRIRGEDGKFHPVPSTVGPPGKDGSPGKDGAPGADGGYYKPSVSESGDLTWTASKEGMPAVSGANIKGPQGNAGADGADGKTAYQAAKEGGYTGTEVEFNSALGGMKNAPFLPLKGGHMNGNIRMSGSSIWFISSGEDSEGAVVSGAYADGNPYISFAGSENDEFVTLKGVSVPKELNDAANKRYVDGKAGGKRVARFTVGTSTAGWTSADCDYLCDGTDDQEEINAAIQALPSTGGEIVILDGTYNITATIAMDKDNVKLSGNRKATVLKRTWNSSVSEGVITITAGISGCCIESFWIDGNKEVYNSNKNYGIYLSGNNNAVTGNTCNNNSYGIYLFSYNTTITGNICNNSNNYGIYMYGGDNNTVTGNTCNNNSYGAVVGGNNNTVTGNTCNNNIYYGIYLSGNNNAATGNTCSNNSSGIYLSGSNNTVTGNTYNNNHNGIYMPGGDNNTVTGNTCNNNNNYGIYMSGNNNNNTVTGNTCIRGSGQVSDYTGSQQTIRLIGVNNNYNLIACNNIMGKNYTSDGGVGNTFVNNKYN